jgi:hypothetical protein
MSSGQGRLTEQAGVPTVHVCPDVFTDWRQDLGVNAIRLLPGRVRVADPGKYIRIHLQCRGTGKIVEDRHVSETVLERNELGGAGHIRRANQVYGLTRKDDP